VDAWRAYDDEPQESSHESSRLVRLIDDRRHIDLVLWQTPLVHWIYDNNQEYPSNGSNDASLLAQEEDEDNDSHNEDYNHKDNSPLDRPLGQYSASLKIVTGK
jgi:hypothetical protein